MSIFPAPDDLLARLPPALYRVVQTAVAVAANAQTPIALVGGVVRDLLLNRPPERDLDLAVDGPLTALLAPLSAALGAQISAQHAAFETATLTLGDLTLDLARTRREDYPQPAALPHVTPAPLVADLARRDFSLNALAISLELTNGPLRAAAWHDPFGGVADLTARQLRLLHAASLRDDPTRILRGIRLAARLSLTLEPQSATWLAEARAANYLALLSAERIASELCLALDEPDLAATLATAEAWGMLAQIIPGLAVPPALPTQHALNVAHPDLPPRWLLLGVLVAQTPAADWPALARRYRLPREPQHLIEQVRAASGRLPTLAPSDPVSLDRALQPFSALSLQAAAFGSEHASLIAEYLGNLRPLQPLLNGDDLLALGLTKGPAVGAALRQLREERLRGQIFTRNDEVQFIQRLIAAKPISP